MFGEPLFWVLGLFIFLIGVKYTSWSPFSIAVISVTAMAVSGWFGLALLTCSVIINFLVIKILLRYRILAFILVAIINFGLIVVWRINTDFFDFNSLYSVPIGISFYGIQQILFLIDSTREEKENFSFLQYFNFITFFPQLVAGPICRRDETFNYFSRGVLTRHASTIKCFEPIALGVFLKFVIADGISPFITEVYSAARLGMPIGMLESWLTIIGYSIEIYFDFWGYCLIGIGFGLFFGIKLPINFVSPYQATNPVEFWTRWHISLSATIRDYVYVPLIHIFHKVAFRRLAAIIALLIAFMLSALWHGFGWGFVVWGLGHAVGVIFYRVAGSAGRRLPDSLCRILLFGWVSILWVFFKGESLDQSISLLLAAFSLPVTVPLGFDFLTWFPGVELSSAWLGRWDLLSAAITVIFCVICIFGDRFYVIITALMFLKCSIREPIKLLAHITLFFGGMLLLIESGSSDFIYFAF